MPLIHFFGTLFTFSIILQHVLLLHAFCSQQQHPCWFQAQCGRQHWRVDFKNLDYELVHACWDQDQFNAASLTSRAKRERERGVVAERKVQTKELA